MHSEGSAPEAGVTEEVPRGLGWGAVVGGSWMLLAPAWLPEASCPDPTTLPLPQRPLLFPASLSLGLVTSLVPCRLHTQPAARRGDESHTGPLGFLQRQGGGPWVPPSRLAGPDARGCSEPK